MTRRQRRGGKLSLLDLLKKVLPWLVPTGVAAATGLNLYITGIHLNRNSGNKPEQSVVGKHDQTVQSNGSGNAIGGSGNHFDFSDRHNYINQSVHINQINWNKYTIDDSIRINQRFKFDQFSHSEFNYFPSTVENNTFITYPAIPFSMQPSYSRPSVEQPSFDKESRNPDCLNIVSNVTVAPGGSRDWLCIFESSTF